MKPHRLPPMPCPSCGERISGARHAERPERPRDGDLGVCLSCAAVLMFDHARRPQRVAPAMLEHLQREEPDTWAELQRVRGAALVGMRARSRA